MDIEQVAPRAANEYAELKRQVFALGLLNRQSRYYVAKLAATGACLVLASVGLALSGSNTWLRIADAVFLAFVFVQIGLLAHDAAHQQIVGAGKRNALAGLVLGNLLLGVSRGWWRDNHDAHHARPNDLNDDPNLQIYLLGCTPEQALSRPTWVQWIVRHQVTLLVPIFCLEFFSMQYQSIEFVLQRKPRPALLEGVLLAAHFAIYGLGLYLVLGLQGAVLFALLHESLTGLYLASIFAPNHKGMPLRDALAGPPGFLHEQVLTARNVRGGALVDLLYGGLNYQVEHHLFPAMPRSSQNARTTGCARCRLLRGIAYSETGVLEAWREIIGHFAEVSRSMDTRERQLRSGASAQSVSKSI